MPEHLDAITTISRDMFYCIIASKFPSQKKKKKPPTDHKISENRTLTNYFSLPLALQIVIFPFWVCLCEPPKLDVLMKECSTIENSN